MSRGLNIILSTIFLFLLKTVEKLARFLVDEVKKLARFLARQIEKLAGLWHVWVIVT